MADRNAVAALTNPLTDGARLVVQVWLGTRLLLIGLAVWVGMVSGRSASDILANWDVQHFFTIATAGYVQENDIAFFPGWPALIRLVSLTGLPLLYSGLLLALVFSALAAWALFRLGGAVAAIAWLLAPTAVFTFVPYTESMFCAAGFWAWERATRGRWGAAAALAAVACTSRVSGLFLVGALVILAVTQRRTSWTQVGRRLLWLGVPALTLFGYALFLYRVTGSWTAWYDAQSAGWGRGFTMPWESFQHTWEAASSQAYPDYPEWSLLFRFEIVSMAIGLLVAGLCVGLRRWAQASWVGVQVLAFSTSYWFISVNRAVLLWFPLYLLIADFVSASAGGPRWRRIVRGLVIAGVVAASVWVMGYWALLFHAGRWAS